MQSVAVSADPVPWPDYIVPGDAQRAALRAWRMGSTEAEGFASRDLSLGAFGQARSLISVCNVLRESGGGVIDARVRDEGQTVERYFGASRGELLSMLYETTHFHATLRLLVRCCQSGAPEFEVFAVTTEDGRERTFSQLLLPFRDGSGRVDQVAFVHDLRVHDSQFPNGPLSMHSTLRRFQDPIRRWALPVGMGALKRG